MNAISIQDDGFVTLNVQDGDTVRAVPLDVLDTYQKMLDIIPDEESKNGFSYYPAWVEFVSGLVGVKVSFGFCDTLYRGLLAKATEIRKKDPFGPPSWIPKPSDSPSGRTTESPTPPDSSGGVWPTPPVAFAPTSG